MTWWLYCVYHSTTYHTYIGTTNNLHRRLRQHNGEIQGGAKYTTSKILTPPTTTANQKVWKYLFVVRFPTQSDALKVEWRLHRHRRVKPIPASDFSAWLKEQKSKHTHECNNSVILPCIISVNCQQRISQLIYMLSHMDRATLSAREWSLLEYIDIYMCDELLSNTIQQYIADRKSITTRFPKWPPHVSISSLDVMENIVITE